MPSLSLLYKTVVVAALLLSSVAYASIFQEQSDDLINARHTFGQSLVHRWTKYLAKDLSVGTPSDEITPPAYEMQKSHDDGGFFQAFSHPDFPKYSLRYKLPEICDPSVKQISGYIDIEEDKHLFFWFFESRTDPKKDPLILYLEGGPACSSMIGLFTVMGPCRINEHGNDTTLNEFSWNKNANIIFLDQPLNVGYSHGKDPAQTSHEAANDVFTFLQVFFKAFPEYSELDFHVAGESYGGHYVPAVGGRILDNNKSSQTNHTINLKSLLIGNGNTDPLEQYKYFGQYACGNSYGPALNQSMCDLIDSGYASCAALISKCYESQQTSSCLPAYQKCNENLVVPFKEAGRNPFDIRQKCTEDFCYGAIMVSFETYLNRPDVLSAIGAEVGAFKSCNDELSDEFISRDWMLPLMNEIPPLLEDEIRVLIYAGDADYICNWMGNKAWMMKLPWSGHSDFATAKDTAWFSQTANEQGGELRRTKDGLFSFLRIFDAGHMVAHDRGDFAIDMLNEWLRGELE